MFDAPMNTVQPALCTVNGGRYAALKRRVAVKIDAKLFIQFI